MNRQRFLPVALGLLTLARLLLLARTELSAAEAHAAVCAGHAEFWHPQTGPLLPVLMRISMSVFGANEFGVRFFAPVLMLGAGWLVWRVALGLFDAPVAAWAAALFQVLPVVNVASITFTNTTLGIACAAAMLALLRLALHRPRPLHLHWWSVAVMSAFAVLADWRLVMMSLGGAGSLLLTRRGRSSLLKWPVTPILAGTLALTATVFLAWNSEHRWAAFHFAGVDSAFWSALGSLFFAYGPLLPLVFGWALTETALQRPLTYATAFLYAFALPLITLELLTIHTTSWPQIGFAAWVPALVMLAACHLMQTERVPTRVKVAARSGLFIIAALQTCLVLPVRPSQIGKWDALGGWRATAQAVREALDREHITEGNFFLVTNRWPLAASLGFYLRDLKPLRPTDAFPTVHLLADGQERSPLDPWPRYDDEKQGARFEAATAVFIADGDMRHQPPHELREKWKSWRTIEVARVTHHGRAMRIVKVFACSAEPAAEK